MLVHVYSLHPRALLTSFGKGSLRQDFCREALSWRSLVHRSIIPLLGIFEDRSQLYLVSPFMTNGTLSEWRKKQILPHVAELHRLVRTTVIIMVQQRKQSLSVRC